jgi:hypothetical protein
MTDGSEQDAPLEAVDDELAERLVRERPVPAAELRGALGRRLASNDPGYGPRPANLRIVAALYLGAGAAIMLLGALQATGAL